MALAWTIKSSEGEFASYQGLSLSYLYLGMIDKVKFFDTRINHGEYEPQESHLYRITVSTGLQRNNWLKNDDGLRRSLDGKTPLEQVWDQAEDLSKLETHLTKFFTDKLTDFSMIKPDAIKVIREVNKHFEIMKNDKSQLEEMRDPSAQFLDTLSPIGTPRLFKGLNTSLADTNGQD